MVDLFKELLCEINRVDTSTKLRALMLVMFSVLIVCIITVIKLDATSLFQLLQAILNDSSQVAVFAFILAVIRRLFDLIKFIKRKP